MKKILDPNTLIHRILSYGVAFCAIFFAMYTTPGAENLQASAGTLIIVFILYYTLLTKRILETLLFATAIGVAMISGKDFVNGFTAQLYETMADADFAWIVLMCCFLNVFNKLLGKTGSLHAFASVIRNKIKKPKDLNFASWILQFPLFFDDYMTIAVGGSILAPIYDEMDVPREEGAFIIHSLAEPLRVLFPITSWAAFLGSLYVSGQMGADGTGMTDFFKTIPYNFYPIVAFIGTALFALGKLPKLGKMKNPDKTQYVELENMEEVDPNAKHGTLLDFFLPIAAMIGAAFFFEFDIVPAMILVLPATVVFYFIRGIINTEDVEECFVNGFAEFMSLILLFCLSYMLNAVLSKLGYVDYLAGVVKSFINPKLLPFIIFVVFCISEGIMSLNWGLLLIAFPMLLPVAVKIGANPYLTAAAMISAGCFGCNFCYICDYTMLTASVFGLRAEHHASTCVPYSLLFGAISAVLFLVVGLLV